MTLGEIIRVYRKEHGLSQRQFAALCGDVSNGYISMIERGKNPVNGKPIILSVEKVAMFARAMGMSINQLVEMADDMPIDIGDSTNDNYQSITSDVYAPKTEQARILAAGVDRLPKAERERALEFARLLFVQYADYFERNDDDDNDTES